jgi:hypothetical protein
MQYPQYVIKTQYSSVRKKCRTAPTQVCRTAGGGMATYYSKTWEVGAVWNTLSSVFSLLSFHQGTASTIQQPPRFHPRHNNRNLPIVSYFDPHCHSRQKILSFHRPQIHWRDESWNQPPLKIPVLAIHLP